MGAQTIRKKVSDMVVAIKRRCLSSDASPNRPVTSGTVNLNPILVFQMGRVGSNSIEHSLRSSYAALSLDVPVYHAHYMDSYEKVEARAEQDLADASLFVRDLHLAKEMRKKLVDDPRSPRLKVISLVRDIISRNVSAFFYALPEFIPDWEQRLSTNSLTVEHLHEVFLSKESYETTALNWFDEQMKPTFDIDVYETSFPAALGYRIYSSRKADLMVVRLESLQTCVTLAVREFLGLVDFNLSRVNTGDERKTGELQRLFKTKPLPADYVKRMYLCKLSRHFYTDCELDSFARYWTEDRKNVNRET